MQPPISDTKPTLGHLLAQLRRIYHPDSKELSKALQTSHSTYLKIERGQRELSFLMALRLCRFYKLDLHDFISMLSDEELERNDLSVIKAQQRRGKKKAAAIGLNNQ